MLNGDSGLYWTLHSHGTISSARKSRVKTGNTHLDVLTFGWANVAGRSNVNFLELAHGAERGLARCLPVLVKLSVVRIKVLQQVADQFECIRVNCSQQRGILNDQVLEANLCEIVFSQLVIFDVDQMEPIEVLLCWRLDSLVDALQHLMDAVIGRVVIGQVLSCAHHFGLIALQHCLTELALVGHVEETLARTDQVGWRTARVRVNRWIRAMSRQWWACCGAHKLTPHLTWGAQQDGGGDG